MQKLQAKPLAEDFGGDGAAAGVILKLIFTYFTNGKITGFWIGYHHATHTGMRLHGTALSKAYANLFHIQYLI